MGITLKPEPQILRTHPEVAPGADFAEGTDMISFSENCLTCCVGVIDIVNSTKITSRLTRQQTGKFYSTFINWAIAVVRAYGGTVVKNTGDGLLFYFSFGESEDGAKGIENSLDAAIAMSRLHPSINRKFHAESLPEVDYRISLDYGEVSFTNMTNAHPTDIFGVTVNICAKINGVAMPNTVIIGGDMYQVSKKLARYSFHDVKKTILISNRPYPIYSVAEPDIVQSQKKIQSASAVGSVITGVNDV